jgi:hypothetical protein
VVLCREWCLALLDWLAKWRIPIAPSPRRPRWSLPAPPVAFSVAIGAECNQVVHHVPAKSTPGLYVMNLQVLHGSAVLALPTISFQHLVSDHGVFFWRAFEPGLLLA